MKVIIIEDELPSSRRLERMLSEYDYEILARLVSIKSAIQWFQRNSCPDIIFMDIQLSDGLCFDIFDAMNIESLIVFTTAYDEYSIKAFEYKSVSYLLKPIDQKQLQKAINKATTFFANKKELEELREIIETNNLAVYKHTFTVRTGRKLRIIDISDIEYFYSMDNTTYLKSLSYNYILNGSLNDLENDLNPELFFKVNRKFIINKNSIKDVIPYPHYRLEINLKTSQENKIIVSRNKVKDFKKWIA
jgi:DNA-binding LytR/AlgR family response regulator